MSSLSTSTQENDQRFADIPEETEKEQPESTHEPSEKEKEDQLARQKEENLFYERLLRITRSDDPKEIDTADYQFLTDFSIVNITFTVYRELQNNSFFHIEEDEKVEYNGEEKRKRDELKKLQQFETKGKFRICQLYPLILRATIGYYQTIAVNYYQDTIEQRRGNQVPIGLNDKAYAIVCSAVRRLVWDEMEQANQEVGGQDATVESGESVENVEHVECGEE